MKCHLGLAEQPFARTTSFYIFVVVNTALGKF